MPKYNPVTPDDIEQFERICGKENVLSGTDSRLARYARDQVSEERYAHKPEVAVKPSTPEEIASILKLAYTRLIPVTPRGAGSGLSGGAVPLHGGISLSLERMNRIIEIDPANLMAVVEPGVVTNKLDEALERTGLFFAGYPLSEEICYVGGNVAENAGGGRAIKYGVTGEYVKGLEVVTPNGDVIRMGGKRVKDVTGYNLIGLMVGSEGTLGIFTKITLKLLPRPAVRMSLLALFREVKDAIDCLPAIMTGEGIVPTSAELMDRRCLHEACRDLQETLPYEEAGAALLLEADGPDERTVRSQLQTMNRICAATGAIEILEAESAEDIERFWRLRKQIPWTLKRRSPHQSVEDIVVPIAAIPQIVECIDAIAAKYEISIPVFGHAGDGNLHATPQMNPDQSIEHWEAILPEILAELYRETARLGGTISGEHGIGHKRKKYMPLAMGQEQIEMMRSIKRALDPRGILNPGKIFEM